MADDKRSKMIIRNVACLDLRTTGEETLASIERIENTASVLYSPQTADWVARLDVVNVASVLEAPRDAQVITGQEFVRHSVFTENDEPINMIIFGQLMFMPDVVADDVRTGIDKLIITGQVLYPEHLTSIIQSKIAHISGQSVPYSIDAKLTVGKLDLSESYLNALNDGSALMVIGKLTARKILPNDLIARKLRDIKVIGSFTCREENSAVLLERLNDSYNLGHTNVIPAGYEPVNGLLKLDAALLAVLPARKLYSSDIHISDDVDPEQLDEAVDALKATHLLISPANLAKVVARKCNLLETTHVLYSGALWYFDDEDILLPQRFTFVDGKVTIVVTGELTIAADVTPEDLVQRVDKVHNLGEIICTPAQMAALQSRLGLGQGEFTVANAVSEEMSGFGNTAYLKL